MHVVAARPSLRVLLGLLALAVYLLAGSAAADTTIAAQIDAIVSKYGSTPEKGIVALRRLEPRLNDNVQSERREYLANLGYLQALAGQTEPSLRTADALEEWARRHEDADGVAESHLVRCSIHLRLGRLAESDADSRRAIDLITPQTPLDIQYWAALERGMVTEALNRLSEALVQYQNATTLGEKLAQPRRQSLALGYLSGIYLRMNQYDKGLATIEQACALDESTHDEAALAWHLLDKAWLYRDADKLALEAQTLARSLAIARKIDSQLIIGLSLITLSDHALHTGDYVEAVSYSRQAQPIFAALNDWDGQSAVQANIGLALTLSGQVEAGKAMIESAIRSREEHGQKARIPSLLREYGDALKKVGLTAQALEVLLRERTLADAMREEEKQQLVVELQAKYQSDKQQREIALLNRENALKSAELENRTLHQRVWWLLLVIFALFSLVVGLLYRRVRQANIQLAERNKELAFQSSRDPLTGLYNRRHFQHRMEHFQVERARNAERCPLAAIYLIDIDHFKRINDRLGHAAGDAVLITLSNRLRDALREADMIVRWGGEEFLVYVPDIPPERVDDLARRIMATISDHPVAYEGKQIHVTASVGYATSPLEPGHVRLPWEREINLIDMALYLGKAHGRSRAFGIRKLHQASLEAVCEIERDLEQAWNRGMVELVVSVGPPPRPVE